jgi:hypothetical protein
MLVVTVVTACLLVFSGIASAQGNRDNAFERVKEVQERHTDKLMEQDGVVGTAVGLDEKRGLAVLVLLERPDVPDIPTDLEGAPVRAMVTGTIYALAKPPAPTGPAKPGGKDTTPPAAPSGLTADPLSSSQIKLAWTPNVEPDLSCYNVYRSAFGAGPYSRIASGVTTNTYSDAGLPSSMTYYYQVTAVDKSRNESAKSVTVPATTFAGPMPALWCQRPVPIGVSTGHPSITAGTIGCRVTGGGNFYALSNNHVYANENKAHTGDDVLQPGAYDEGIDPRDAIGTLYAFCPIVFSRTASNTIDAAIAQCTPATLGNSAPGGSFTPSRTTAPATVGLAVQKYGRTTSLTKGNVDAINATINVSYGSGKTGRFVNQIVITPGTFSAGGDSGSLIVTQSGKNPVGLLFAGSSSVTIANPIDLVLRYFGVTVDGE